MPLQAWFPDEIVSVEPGGSIRLPLTVENPAPHRDGCTITPAGIRASWMTVAQPSVVLDAGTAAVIDVWLHPPLVATTSAGRNEVSVRILADSEPSLSLTVDAVVEVGAFDDRTLTFAQPVVRARGRANFDLIVNNGGNAMADVRMKLVDPTQRMDGEFDPPAVTVPPGESSTVRLRVRAHHGLFRTADRLLTFDVDASETGHPTATASGSLLQTRNLSARWFARLVPMLIALGLVAAAWVWGARPWVEREIDQRVAEQVATNAPGTGETPVRDEPTPDPPDDSPESAEARTETVRLVATTPVGETAEAVFTPTDGTALLITDLVLQNPQRDSGRASLRVDDQVWYEWELDLMSGPNEFQPRVSPLRVEAAQTLTFAVECDTAGNTEADGCDVAILVGGRVVELDE